MSKRIVIIIMAALLATACAHQPQNGFHPRPAPTLNDPPTK